MSSVARTRSREFLVIGGVPATISKPAPNVTRIEMHAATEAEEERFIDGLAEMLQTGAPIASPGLVPDHPDPLPGSDNRTEWRAGRPLAPDPTKIPVAAPAAVSDAAVHGDASRTDPDTDR